ncbi:ogr/Delta-like zinc finger family protein [Altericroceibacterium endophyticum]|uniref:Zinc finger Ogr/Delta-type domain-containing protein n=1 Tax=Altericroceibacterium endophyticum TaxID=1808508 RepID=A0A6I4T1R2_9SPHN|nr:ogr/Delta-like zinc finger family protein [Altericroceibacterium endophyticum]MXO64876.1 hypothetical protein [Altericroceibacterium endophyticum]
MAGEGALSSRPAGHHTRLRRGSVICPVCHANGRIEGSEHVTDLVKTLWVHCSNTSCGMTWRMHLSFEFVISPSAIHRPDLNLPGAPSDYPRQTYAPGPPASVATAEDAHDPNQMTIFDNLGGKDPKSPP